MKAALAAIVAAVAVVGIGAITTTSMRDRDAAERTLATELDIPTEGCVEPMLTNPVALKRSFHVNCASVDAGTAVTDVLVPMDGGTSGNPMPASTVYVAPVASSSVKVRVGSSDVTASTGFQVGTSARDGAGVSMDAKGPIRCKSEGAAQKVDVIVGVQ